MLKTVRAAAAVSQTEQDQGLPWSHSAELASPAGCLDVGAVAGETAEITWVSLVRQISLKEPSTARRQLVIRYLLSQYRLSLMSICGIGRMCWAQVLCLLFSGCVAQVESLNLSEPWLLMYKVWLTVGSLRLR